MFIMISSFIFLLASIIPITVAFPSQIIARNPTLTSSLSSSSSSLNLSIGDDFFDIFKNLWGAAAAAGGGGGGGNSDSNKNNSDDSFSDSQDNVAGTTLITSIPGTFPVRMQHSHVIFLGNFLYNRYASDKRILNSSILCISYSTLLLLIVQSIKPGGLRLFLMFYLMGIQNTPDKGTWKANQPSTEEYIVEMYFRDATAMVSIELLDHEIRISRCGSVPSTPYLMQESVIVQGILEELDRCAFDETVPVASRLLTPDPSNAIELARGSLSFG